MPISFAEVIKGATGLCRGGVALNWSEGDYRHRVFQLGREGKRLLATAVKYRYPSLAVIFTEAAQATTEKDEALQALPDDMKADLCYA